MNHYNCSLIGHDLLSADRKNGPQSSVGESLHKTGIGAGIAQWVEGLSEKIGAILL